MRYAVAPYHPPSPPSVTTPAPVPPTAAQVAAPTTVHLPPQMWTHPIQITLTLVPPPPAAHLTRPALPQPPPLPVRPPPPRPEPRPPRARRLVLETVFLLFVLSALTLAIVLLHGIGFDVDYIAPVEFMPNARTP